MSATIKPSQLALYYSPTCPYCHRVLDAMVKLGLNVDLNQHSASGIQLENTSSDKTAKQALKDGGGRTMVPCLRITHNDGTIQWLYESLDIVAYLKENLVI